MTRIESVPRPAPPPSSELMAQASNEARPRSRVPAGAARLVERWEQSARRALAQASREPRPALTATQRHLDRHLRAADATYRIGNQSVRVTPGFRMNGGFGPSPAEAFSRLKSTLSPRVIATLGGDMVLRNAVHGKASATTVHETTRALISAGAIDSALAAKDPSKAVRQLMFVYGLGLDCSCYAFTAFEHIRGVEKTSDGTLPRRVVPIRHVQDLKPGDLVLLTGKRPGETGHKVIVYSHRVLPSTLPVKVNGAEVPHEFLEGGPIRALEVDSSWGNGGRAERGGVSRRTWLFNESTGQWGDFKNGNQFRTTAGPYDHRLGPMFRSSLAASRDPG